MSEVQTHKFNPEDIYPTPNSGRFKATDDDSKTYHQREGILTTEVHDEATRRTARKKFLQRLDDKLPRLVIGSILVGGITAYVGLAFSKTMDVASLYDVAEMNVRDQLIATVSNPGLLLQSISKLSFMFAGLLILYSIIKGIINIVKDSRKPLDKIDDTPTPPPASIGT